MAAAREFLMLVKESALNTPMSAPVAGTDLIYVRLTDGNAFGAQTKPVYERIPYGGGVAIMTDYVTDHYMVQANLKTNLYPTQAKFLMDWATTRINTAQTTPWVTTEPPGDLASVSAYYAVQRSDGTFLRKRYGGCKVSSCTINISRDGTVAKLNLGITACRSFGNAYPGESATDPDATEFPAPSDSSYPTGPYTFVQTAGHVVIRTSGAAVRSKYENLDISFANKLDGAWFETAGLQVLKFTGRDSKLDANLLFQATPDDRSVLESATPQVASVEFHNGTTGQNMTINYHAKNFITDLPYDLALDKIYRIKMTLENAYDLSAGSDLDVTFA